MTIAEIIEEHDKLETLRKDAGSGYWYANTMALRHFYCDHFAALLAIARAAAEAERLTAIFQRDYITAPPDADSTAWTQRAWAASGEADEAIERLFAAVRGDAATREGR